MTYPTTRPESSEPGALSEAIILEKELNQLGGRSPKELKHDEKGSFVFMADGKHGLYKYYL